MRNQRGLQLVVLLACGTAIGSSRPETRPPTPPVVASVAPEPAAGPPPDLRLAGIAYEADAYGGTVTAALAYELRNGGEELARVRFEWALPRPLEAAGLALDSGGAVSDLALEMLEDKGQRGNRGRESEPAAQRLRSEPFEIPGGEDATLRLKLRLPLSVESGRHRVVLPAVEEPRGVQARPADAPPRTMRVTLLVHHDAPLLSATSSTHEVLVDFAGDHTVVEPVAGEIPARTPFAFEFATSAPNDPILTGYLRGERDGRHAIEVVLHPPAEPEIAQARPEQVLFVLDTSGSMTHQDKIGQARRAILRSVEMLDAADRFNVVEFDNDVTLLHPRAAGKDRLDRATLERWLSQLKADGGTLLLPALAVALDQPEDPGTHRILIVVTDGIWADEAAVPAFLEKRLGDARVFVVGTGTPMRQETLLRLAETGRGAATFAGEPESLEQAVAELFESIANPLGWDVGVDWEGSDVEEIQPWRIPDLYAGRPVRVLAHVRGEVPSALALTMSTTEGTRRFRVSLPPLP